jgi:hypothetical protein
MQQNVGQPVMQQVVRPVVQSNWVRRLIWLIL